MLHPAAHPALTQASGVGLFATKPIPSGTVVWHPSLHSLQVTPNQFSTLPHMTMLWLDELGYRLSDGNVILPSGGACFFNHSCNPNVVDHGLDFGIAVRHIAPGEQLTLDYSCFVFDPLFEFRCQCGARECREIVTNRVAPSRERQVPAAAVEQLRRRSQPLRRSLLQSSRSYAEIANGAGILTPRSICDPPRRLPSKNR